MRRRVLSKVLRVAKPPNCAALVRGEIGEVINQNALLERLCHPALQEAQLRVVIPDEIINVNMREAEFRKGVEESIMICSIRALHGVYLSHIAVDLFYLNDEE